MEKYTGGLRFETGLGAGVLRVLVRADRLLGVFGASLAG